MKKTRKRRQRRTKRHRRKRRTKRRTKRRRRKRGGVATLWSLAAETTHKEKSLKNRRDREKKSIHWEMGDKKCYICKKKFNIINREHHCRSCGKVVCGKHSKNEQQIYKYPIEISLRICDICAEREKEIIDNIMKKSSTNKQNTISALRRSMLENCTSRQSCRQRSRFPTPGEIKRAKNVLNDDNSQFSMISKNGYDSWDVKKYFKKKYPLKKQKVEKRVKDLWEREVFPSRPRRPHPLRSTSKTRSA